MNLIHDHRACRCEHLAAGFRAEQDVERLGRRDHDVRRTLAHAVAFVLGSIARAHESSDVDIGQFQRPQLRTDAAERGFEVAPDVVREGFERGDVHDMRLVRQAAALDAFAHQALDRREKGRERLARPRRRGDQNVVPRLNGRPGLLLRRRRRVEGSVEPVGDGRME